MSKDKGGNPVKSPVFLDKVHGGREPMQMAPTPPPSQRIPLEEGREPVKMVPAPQPPAPAPAPVPPPAPASDQKTP